MTRTIALAALSALLLAACGEETETADPAPTPTPDFATIVRGPLAEGAKGVHDMIAGGGQADAQAAGDLSHDALVSTTLLGAEEGHFLGIDQWSDAQAMAGFYANPAFAEGLGAMFSGPPTVAAYARRTDWHGWGELDSADGGDHWFVVAAGTLAKSADESQALHDMLAGGGEGQAKDAGDVAHVVFLGLEDDRQFLAVDVWRSAEAIEAFYGNPDFQAGFAMLFAAPPTVTVYHSTDWHQW